MSELTLNKEKHIKHIIYNFDFEKVHKIMITLNWKWAVVNSDNNFEYNIPSLLQLKDTATYLLEKFEYDNYDTLSTGGFKVTKKYDYLELEFIISDCSSNQINYDEPKYEILKNNKKRKKKINTINKL